MQIDSIKLLQGHYEADRLPRDFSSKQSVPDYAYNILNIRGLLYRPVLDEKHLEKGGRKPCWPGGKPFAVCITHDVDKVSEFSLHQSVHKRRMDFLLKSGSTEKIKTGLGAGLDLIRAIRKKGKVDPFHCYEKWLEIESEFDAHSTFFFWPGLKAVSRNHPSDCLYELSDKVVFDNQECCVAEMIREMDSRGWEIGLHPSWYTFNDIDELRCQKESVESVLGHEIVSLRHHYLHYDIRITPRIDALSGFRYDSTLGFNDNIGFRFGTSYPWFLYDLKAGQELGIMEIPLIIADNAMLHKNKGMRVDTETAFEYITRISSRVEKVGGVLTLLWHPSHIVRPDYWELYHRTLRHLKEQNAWFGSVREIGEHWIGSRNEP